MTTKPDETSERIYTGVLRLAELVESQLPDHVPDESSRVFLVGWGLLACLMRQACVVIRLQRDGFELEAAPNQRLMIEYMAKLRHLAEHGETAIDSMNSATKYAVSSLLYEVDQKGHFPVDAATRATAATTVSTEVPKRPTDQYNNVGNVVKDFGGPFHELWKAITALSHPGTAAAQLFFKSESDGNVLYATPQGQPMPTITQARALLTYQALLEGMHAFNRIMPNEPWAAELDQICADIDIPRLRRRRHGSDA